MPARTDTASLAIDAAYALLQKGVHPSIQAVRERLGKGSMTTIHAALQDFWAEVGRRLARPDLPPPLVDGVHQLWQAALDQAEGTFARDREALEQRAQAAEVERAAAWERQQALAAEVAALMTRCEQLQAEKTDLEADLEAERTRRAAAETGREKAEAAASAAQAALEKAEARAEADRKTERARHETFEQRLTGLYDDEKTARERLEKLLERQQAAQQVERAEQQQRLQGLNGELTTLREQLTEWKARLAEQTAALQGAAEIRQLLETELAGRERTMEELRTAHDRALRERDEAVQECRVLRAEIERQRRAEMEGDPAAATSVEVASERAESPEPTEDPLPRRPQAGPSAKPMAAWREQAEAAIRNGHSLTAVLEYFQRETWFGEGWTAEGIRTLVSPDPYRRAVRREIEARRGEGLSWTAVAKTLNERQIPTLDGRGRWTGPSVRKLVEQTS